MFEDIETFIQVVELNSFAKAAKKLHISPPMVTRRISQLENILCVKLLQRTTRELTVTEAGKLFYLGSLDMLNTYASITEQIHDISSKLTGTLKIGLPASISSLYVMPALPAFLKQYPNISIHIVQGNHLVDLLSDGYDLIVHCGPLPDSNFYSKKITSWTKITCASPSYFATKSIPHQPQDLLSHNCLDHINNYSKGWYYEIDNQKKLIPINGNIRLDSSLSIKEMITAGLGIGYLPSFTVKPEIESGSLVPILTEYQVPALEMFVIYPSKQFINQKTKVFIDFLMALDMGI